MDNEILVEKEGLVAAVQKMLAAKARLGTANYIDFGDKFEIIYHFEPQDKPEPLTRIRIKINKDDTLPSISSLFLCATLIENELKDLFDIKISGTALDFQSKVIRTGESPEQELVKPADYAFKPPPHIEGRVP